MYEFTKKEIRNEFKKTEYGSKVNVYLYSSLIIWVVFCAIGVLNLIFYLQTKNNILLLFFILSCFLDSFALLFMCYFDGKRDGAIEQYKRTLK